MNPRYPDNLKNHITLFIILLSLPYTSTLMHINEGDILTINGGKLNSIKTSIPFSFSKTQSNLPMCRPSELIKDRTDTLGNLLLGESVYNTIYKVKADGSRHACQFACSFNFTDKSYQTTTWLIDNDYEMSYYFNYLPGVLKVGKNAYYESGIPIGFKTESLDYYIYNHLRFNIDYNKNDGNFNIVGFFIEPFSVESLSKENVGCNSTKTFSAMNPERIYPSREVQFTYDVVFRLRSDITFATRWDRYMVNTIGKDSIHYMSFIYSVTIIVILSMIVLHIFCRSVRKDIILYNTVRVSL